MPIREAILGAPGTGKSALANALCAQHEPSAALTILDNPPLPDAPNAWDLVLLMGLDLPVGKDRLAGQQQADAHLRAWLADRSIPHATIYGQGPLRPEQAQQVIAFHQQRPTALPAPRSRWRWACEKCSDPECEHRLFRDLAIKPPLEGA